MMKMLALLLLSLNLQAQELQRRQIGQEYLIKFKSNDSIKGLGSETTDGLVKIDLSQKNAISKFDQDDIEWMSPNYEYIGNPQETSPTDPEYSKQYHHQIIKSQLAWDLTLGNDQVVVAVTDNGYQMDHPDLKQAWWVNRNEIPGNGIDDDNNGYIDDINGWDFNRNIADPSPKESNSHGTHVAGIIAAQMNGEGVVGIAPQVKIMPLKFYEPNYSWTSEVIYKTFKYAIDNGADIITTSYNIDGLVNDKAYLEVIKLAEKKGVILVNSGGNSNQANPPRQKLDYLVLVCSTQSGSSFSKHDQKSRFSNYGTGLDICAPGDPIHSTVNGVYQGQYRYGEMSGTSMAAPVVAAVLALVKSEHPTWIVDQIKKQVFDSADNIDSINQRYKGMLGAGRVNAFKALSF